MSDPARPGSAGKALAGQIAFVAGGSGGIGAAIAEALAIAGADVAVTYRANRPAAEAVVARIRALGRTAVSIGADLSIESEAKHALEVAQRLGAIDILVTSLRATVPDFFMRQREADWDRVWAGDLKAVFHSCRACLDQMIQRNSGRIIFVSSDSAKVGQLGGAVSSAARGALNTFAKSLAREVARHNITVNAVCPGPTNNSNYERLKSAENAHVWQRVVESIPLRRVGEAREVASVVVYLASPDAGYITGQAISVSGGLTMT